MLLGLVMFAKPFHKLFGARREVEKVRTEAGVREVLGALLSRCMGTGLLASYALLGCLLMSYFALTAERDALLAAAIFWLLVLSYLDNQACKESCSFTQVFVGPLRVFSLLRQV